MGGPARASREHGSESIAGGARGTWSDCIHRIQTRKAQMKDSDLCIVFLVSVLALMLIGLTRDAVEPTWQPDNDAPVIVTVP
jgi:hypothetical protein